MPVEEIARRLTNSGLEVEDVRTEGDDVIIETEVTWNRSDLLSHIGTAREISALTGVALELPEVEVAESARPVEELTSVEVLDTDLCPQYTARVITGVRVAPSPAWLADRLVAVGLRPVNNVVDITNFVLLECGQPLHAFDMEKLAERRIIVRRAKSGETITSIDGTRHELDPTVLVICDAAHPVAVAGVMGGIESEIGDDTTDVLLESALFDPASIRDTSRKLSLESDSSYCFERGVDPAGVVWASNRAARLIAEIAGGSVAAGIIDVNVGPYQPLDLTLRVAHFKRIMGFDVSSDRAAEILAALGFEVTARDRERVSVVVPSWRRRDVSREIDLVEEVARVEGLDKVSDSSRIPLARVRENALFEAGKVAKSVLVSAGFYETVTFSFTDSGTNERFNPWGAAGELATSSAFYKELSALRKSLIPSLLAVKKRNHNTGTRSVRLFELAAVYLPRENEKLPEEKQVLALLCDPDPDEVSAARAHGDKACLPNATLRFLKGTIESVLASLGITGARFTKIAEPPGFLAKEAAAGVETNGAGCGYVGLLSDDVMGWHDLPEDWWTERPAVAEIDFDILTANARYSREYTALPRFPGVERDINVVLDASVNWDAISECIGAAGALHLEAVRFVDDFRDAKRLGSGKKSVTARMVFRNPERTLLSDEADTEVQKVLDALGQKFGAVLRT